MSNHFHLVLETLQSKLVTGLRWFLGTCTERFHRGHKRSGHLFNGGGKSSVVKGSGNGYLKTVCDRMHLNRSPAKSLKSSHRCGLMPGAAGPIN